jgi:hypothetical protein
MLLRARLRPGTFDGPPQETIARTRTLSAQLFIEEPGHNPVGFLRLGQAGVIPERVRQGLENYQLGVDAGPQKSPVQEDGPA